MQIINPHREATKLIVSGAAVAFIGIYAIRTGTFGDHLQKFTWWGRRQYTRNPQPRDRRMYQVYGSLFLACGVLAIGYGAYVLVTR